MLFHFLLVLFIRGFFDLVPDLRQISFIFLPELLKPDSVLILVL